jgi:hypothetical protein
MSVKIFRKQKTGSIRKHWSVRAIEEQKDGYKIALQERPINFLSF